MPIYEYICPKCKTKFEEWQNINESSALVACPECQTMSKRIISNTSFILKGDGWYVTEYGNKKNTNSQLDEKTKKDTESNLSNDKSDDNSNNTPSSSESSLATDTQQNTKQSPSPEKKAVKTNNSSNSSGQKSEKVVKETKKKVEKNHD